MQGMPWPKETRKVCTHDVQFHYFEFGNPNGEPLLLVHGFPDAPVGWRAVISGLDETRFRFIVPYLRGFGRTRVLDAGKIGGQQAALGHDLLALMDALDIGRCHVIGHDWGSTTVNAAAVLAPHRLLSLTTLASPYLLWRGGLFPPEQVHAFWYQFYFQLDVAKEMLRNHHKVFCRELWRTWSPSWHFSEREFDEAAGAWGNPQFEPIVLHYYRMRWKNASSLAAYADLQQRMDASPKPTIGVPALHIQGLADACVLPAAVDGQETCFTRGYRRVAIAGAGHFPHREKAGEVITALLGHIDAHLSG